MIAWLDVHAAQLAIGLSMLLALGALGLWLHREPARRHAWVECVLAASLVCAAGLLVPLRRPLQPAATATTATVTAEGDLRAHPAQSIAPIDVDPAPERAMPAASVGFVLGAGLIALRLLVGAFLLARLVRRADPLASLVDERGVRIISSGHARRPFCAGTRRFGVIVVPRTLTNDEWTDEREAVIAHERAHLVAGHGRARLMAALVAPLLFWNPLYWLLVTRMRADAELCADDAAARVLGKPRYARALLNLVERLPAQPMQPLLPVIGALAPARTLFERLESLMSRPHSLDLTPPARSRAVSVALVLLATSLVNVACGTTDSDRVRGAAPTNAFDEPMALSFETLDLEGTDLEKALNSGVRTSAMFPSRVAGFDGQRVSMEGYMIPLSFDGEQVSEFILCRDILECCFGGAPKWGHWVHARADGVSTAELQQVIGRVHVDGDFDLVHPKEWQSSDVAEGVYQLRRWSVLPSEL
ncbi:MAG: M56 family metallopeptidase [Planctomycetota bacterium]